MKSSHGYSLFRRIYVMPLILLILGLSTACSTARKIPEYKHSQLLPPLEIPPELDKPVYNERMKIPEPPVAKNKATGGDVTSEKHSIEEPPVFLEEDDSAK